MRGVSAMPGGKWQRSQRETGLDVVARLVSPRHEWFSHLDQACTTVILEAKGDRLAPGGKINRAAYNEMTGALSAFFLSNFARIRDHPERVYGWLVPRTFHERVIEDFREAHANLAQALPPGCAFLIGTFDNEPFWRQAGPGLRALAREWFGAKDGGRNILRRERLARRPPEGERLPDSVFQFEVVRSAR